MFSPGVALVPLNSCIQWPYDPLVPGAGPEARWSRAPVAPWSSSPMFPSLVLRFWSLQAARVGLTEECTPGSLAHGRHAEEL